VLSKFGDDYRVVAAAPDFEKALGARVLKIGDTAIATVRELAARMTPAAETTALADARIAGFLTMASRSTASASFPIAMSPITHCRTATAK
jgi:hypothetical protein